jgi:hypothetical protein
VETATRAHSVLREALVRRLPTECRRDTSSRSVTAEYRPASTSHRHLDCAAQSRLADHRQVPASHVCKTLITGSTPVAASKKTPANRQLPCSPSPRAGLLCAGGRRLFDHQTPGSRTLRKRAKASRRAGGHGHLPDGRNGYAEFPSPHPAALNERPAGLFRLRRFAVLALVHELVGLLQQVIQGEGMWRPGVGGPDGQRDGKP